MHNAYITYIFCLYLKIIEFLTTFSLVTRFIGRRWYGLNRVYLFNRHETGNMPRVNLLNWTGVLDLGGVTRQHWGTRARQSFRWSAAQTVLSYRTLRTALLGVPSVFHGTRVQAHFVLSAEKWNFESCFWCEVIDILLVLGFGALVALFEVGMGFSQSGVLGGGGATR